MNRITRVFCVSLYLAGSSLAGWAQASELVYTPINPSFGGNPLNGSWLLSNAQAQNDYSASSSSSSSSATGLSTLERFTSQLQSQLLSQVLSNIKDGKSGTLQTDAFIVNIIEDSGSLSVQVTDRATGAVSEIAVNGLLGY